MQGTNEVQDEIPRTNAELEQLTIEAATLVEDIEREDGPGGGPGLPALQATSTPAQAKARMAKLRSQVARKQEEITRKQKELERLMQDRLSAARAVLDPLQKMARRLE